MNDKNKLKSIIKLCKKNDRIAQQRLFDMYKNLMYTICLRYASSNTEAEDMMMEGWVRIFQNINTYNSIGSFEAWMRRVMINNAINTYKANLKHNNVSRIIIEKNNEDIFSLDYIYTEEELIECIQELPNALRLLFNLSAIEEYSNKEIAELLNQSPNSIKSNLYKAKKSLREKLKELKKNG